MIYRIICHSLFSLCPRARYLFDLFLNIFSPCDRHYESLLCGSSKNISEKLIKILLPNINVVGKCRNIVTKYIKNLPSLCINPC